MEEYAFWRIFAATCFGIVGALAAIIFTGKDNTHG
jgi:hypothetical protein